MNTYSIKLAKLTSIHYAVNVNVSSGLRSEDSGLRRIRYKFRRDEDLEIPTVPLGIIGFEVAYATVVGGWEMRFVTLIKYRED